MIMSESFTIPGTNRLIPEKNSCMRGNYLAKRCAAGHKTPVFTKEIKKSISEPREAF
jgi:hypothetical protein